MLKFIFFKCSFRFTNRYKKINKIYITKIAILMIITNALLVNRANAGLSESIQNNLLNYNQSYERITKPKIIKQTPARLWIHMRSNNRAALAKDIYKLTSTIKLNALSVEQRSLQKAQTAPHNSQLRFFKSTDKSNAKYLIDQLRSLFHL